MNIFYKNNRYKIIIIFLLFFIYIFCTKFLRPYFNKHHSNFVFINFILGILPNFIGAIITYTLTRIKLIKISKIKSIVFTLSLVLFMEFERYLNQNIVFDVYDIVSSVIGVTICYYILD